MKYTQERRWGVWIENQWGNAWWDGDLRPYRRDVMPSVRELRTALSKNGAKVTAEKVTLGPPSRLK